MTLCSLINSNAKANAMVSKFEKISKSAADDIIYAINHMANSALDYDEVLTRIDVAYTMCTYMQPAVEDVLSILLHVAFSRNKASCHIFSELFRPNRYEYYYNRMYDACKNAPENPAWSRVDQIDHYIMMRVCDSMFDNLIRTMNKKSVPDTIDIVTAYEMAKSAHHQTKRKSGEPYLTHPIAVASILAEVGVESSIIAAALLHDVVEDTDFTLEDISSKCGQTVAKYVDAVTSVHKQYEASHNRAEYSQDKAQLDAMSFEKLAEAVAADPKMVFALYIKAADRIHNLRTIDKMSSEKKHCKTDETELNYLPLFKRFKLNHFVNLIEDLTWRTSNVEYYETIKSKYEDAVSRNQEYIDDTKQILSARLGNEFNRFCAMRGMENDSYDTFVSERYYLTREVYEFAKSAIDNKEEVKPEHINKRFVPICDFDIIVESRVGIDSLDSFITMFVKMFNERIAPTGRTIIDLYVDGSKRFIVKIEDRHRTMFRLCFCTHDVYIEHKLGSRKGAFLPDVEDNDADEQNESIRVKLRNGKIIYLPNGATVIDVAYAIHPEIGHTAKSAIINGQQVDILHRVHENDQIIVVADTERQNGKTTRFIPHVKIFWLDYVATNKAKKAIIKRLIKQYGEEDPRNENPASDIAASNVADMLQTNLSGLESFDALD